MLDLGLSKIALIGVVALIVIGPKKLPGVARAAGALLGRAQRYVNEVKAEVMREIELDELRQVKTDLEEAAHSMRASVHDQVRQAQADLSEAWNNDEGVAVDADEHAMTAKPRAAHSIWPGMSFSGLPRRKSWRVRQRMLPLWYRRVSGKRIHVQSGAARVARHTPARSRCPMRFF